MCEKTGCENTEDLVLVGHNIKANGEEVARYRCRTCRNKRMKVYLAKRKSVSNRTQTC